MDDEEKVELKISQTKELLIPNHKSANLTSR